MNQFKYIIIFIHYFVNSREIHVLCNGRKETIDYKSDGIYYGRILIWNENMNCTSSEPLNAQQM